MTRKNKDKGKVLPWSPVCEFNDFTLGLKKEKSLKRGKKIKRGKLILEK